MNFITEADHVRAELQQVEIERQAILERQKVEEEMRNNGNKQF